MACALSLSAGLLSTTDAVKARAAARAAARLHPAPRQQARALAPPRHARRAARSAVVVPAVVAAAGPSPSTPHLQLGTAKLPKDASPAAFMDHLYQWASTLTTNGRNLPFALPLKTDRLDDGFQARRARQHMPACWSHPCEAIP